jgi:hypothetical protein
VVPHLGKILLAESIQRHPEHIGSAADEVVHLPPERFPLAGNRFPADKAIYPEDVVDIPVARFPRRPVATLQDEYTLARWGQAVCQRAVPCPAADDDDVVVHRYNPGLPCMIPPSAKMVVAVR